MTLPPNPTNANPDTKTKTTDSWGRPLILEVLHKTKDNVTFISYRPSFIDYKVSVAGYRPPEGQERYHNRRTSECVKT